MYSIFCIYNIKYFIFKSYMCYPIGYRKYTIINSYDAFITAQARYEIPTYSVPEKVFRTKFSPFCSITCDAS